MTQTAPIRWSIVGMGRAGLARARAILSDPQSTLVAVHRGKNADRFPTVPAVPDLETAIEMADAVAICSPDAAHPEQVEAALKRDRHVVCEFPLAPNARSALALIELANRRGRILHVEHIELLHAPQVILRSHTRRDPVVSLSQTFERNGDSEVPPEVIAAGNIARVHRMIDLCGPVKRVCDLDRQPGRVAGRLEHAAGGTSTFAWEQSPYLQRSTKMAVRTELGEQWRIEGASLFRGRVPQTLIEADPLFEQDHRVAVGRIRGTRKHYLDSRRLLHGLQVLRRVADGREGEVGKA